MKTIVVKELENIHIEEPCVLDFTKKDFKSCCGCWTCWWKTPGKCIFKDLNNFYQEYVAADKVIFFAKVKMGFVSGDMKSLFDRMIPLFMPYTSIASGESMHIKRYEKYPDIEFYYEGDFISEEAKTVFEAYVHRVFYMFLSKNIKVAPVAEYPVKECL